MKFALVNGQKVEASKRENGNCIFCSSRVIAKCGEIKVHHWAHLGIRQCDSWLESETEWHRLWKNKFSIEWQEQILYDEITKEKHIADVCTDKGFVVEFQHSHMNPIERSKREEFYKNMVWVVDGTRLKKDYPRLQSSMRHFRQISRNTYQIEAIHECFPQTWTESAVPVVFDFLNHQDIQSPLYCLMPVKLKNYAIVELIPRPAFENAVRDGTWLSWSNTLTANIILLNKELEISPTSQPAFSQPAVKLVYRSRANARRRW
jgi:competence protein CoiA